MGESSSSPKIKAKVASYTLNMFHSEDSIVLVGLMHIHLIKYKMEYNLQIQVNAPFNSNAKSLGIYPSSLPPTPLFL